MEWLAGNRLRGTTAERPALGLPSGSVGGWVELGRTTLGSVNDYVQVSSLPDKRYYMVLSDVVGTGSGVNFEKRVGNSGIDTGSNYATRYSVQGGADTTTTSQTSFVFGFGGVGTNPTFSVDYLANLSNKEKLMISHLNHQATAGAGTVPSRAEVVGKWTNTTNPITDIAAFNSGSSDWAVGSEVVVLGWDPADTHTTNFWEELASVELGSSGDNISSGTITGKKYLWIQAYIIPTGTVNSGIRFNNDSTTNYGLRYSVAGAADATATADNIGLESGSITTPNFINMFCINNASNEKIGWLHGVKQSTAGAATAPNRLEQAHKWANTSDQITEVDVDNFGAGSFDTGSILKVWGAD